jgi:hypothetical protein
MKTAIYRILHPAPGTKLQVDRLLAPPPAPGGAYAPLAPAAAQGTAQQLRARFCCACGPGCGQVQGLAAAAPLPPGLPLLLLTTAPCPGAAAPAASPAAAAAPPCQAAGAAQPPLPPGRPARGCPLLRTCAPGCAAGAGWWPWGGACRRLMCCCRACGCWCSRPSPGRPAAAAWEDLGRQQPLVRPVADLAAPAGALHARGGRGGVQR